MLPRPLAALLVSLAAAACREPTQITLELSTDVECSDVTGASVAVGALGEIENKPAAAITTACANGRIGSLVVTPSTTDDSVAIRAVLAFGRPLDDCTAEGFGPGCVIARRSLGFIAHEPLRLPVALRGDCSGVPCPETQTCVHGRCVGSGVDGEKCASGEGCGDDTLSPDSAGGVGGCGDLTGLLAGSPWPMHGRCPTHQGRSTFAAPSTQPTALWTYESGDHMHPSPVIGADGTVYISSDYGVFLALDGETGEPRWEAGTYGYTDAPAALTADGAVISAGYESGAVALDAKTGALRWQNLDYGPLFSAPVVDGDGSIFFGTQDGRIISLDHDGKERWLTQLGGGQTVWPALAGGLLFTGDDSTLVALDAGNGAEVWKMTLRTASPAVGADGTLYAAGKEGAFALDGRTGNVVWSNLDEHHVVSGVALGADGTVYVSATDDGLIALDGATGERLWIYQPGGAIFDSVSIDATGLVLVSSTDNLLHAVRDGTETWSFEVGDHIERAAAIGRNGTLYLGSNDHKVWALR